MVPAPYFRKAFSLKGVPEKAVLSATALGVYEAEINGQKVSDDVFAPGWTEYRKRVQYQSCEVTHLLRKGDNVLGGILGDGWYCGYVGWRTRQVYGDKPALLMQLAVTFSDGSEVTIDSDSSWKTATGPILESDFLMGEAYDARLELEGWSSPGYIETNWESVVNVVVDESLLIVPRVGPPVRRIAELTPVAVRVNEGGILNSRIYDFGQNFTGRVRISIRSEKGTTVRLRYAEILGPDGGIYTENLRKARATDYYTCKGTSQEQWEPRFTFHGFRYVEITGLCIGDDVELVGIVLHSDIKQTGTFQCSSALLNQLQSNILWGQKSNFLEVPMDCPQRDERLGWTGDAQVFIKTAAFNMDVREFFRKWLQDGRDAQGERGNVPCVWPQLFEHAKEDSPDYDGGPAWSDAMVICPWVVYLCYGDLSILSEHYGAMERFMEFLNKYCCRDLIRSHPDVLVWRGFGDWLALDGSDQVEGGTPKDLIGTAFYAYDARIMSQAAGALGFEGDAHKYRSLYKEIKAAFQRQYVNSDGTIVSGTQTAYSLALHFGLVEDALRAAVAQRLITHIEQQDYHLATGFVGTPYLLHVLEATGHLDAAYKLLEQETFPSWIFPVKNGATTIWERWDGWSADKGLQNKAMNSFNHYAYGAVGEWMYSSVAGLDLDPLVPGYQHIVFRPQPGGTLTWAEATLDTPYGLAGIKWSLEDERLIVRLQIPPHCHGTFQVPSGYMAKVEKMGSGIHHIVANKLNNRVLSSV